MANERERERERERATLPGHTKLSLSQIHNWPLNMQLKWVNRLAMVQNDGTVQFEVPGDIKPQSLDFGTGVVYNGTTADEPVDAIVIPDLPPLQIVMLIVGTRGDVQPFVAIGKRIWS
ncbi:hypothetical protein CsSME_00027734 [Camellia sinensis var. sinensis]